MTEAVDEILIERLAVQVFAVRLYVLPGNLVQGLFTSRESMDLPDWNAAAAAS